MCTIVIVVSQGSTNSVDGYGKGKMGKPMEYSPRSERIRSHMAKERMFSQKFMTFYVKQ